eukprot:11179562-Lingulodinium_polyedra.AAC.1
MSSCDERWSGFGGGVARWPASPVDFLSVVSLPIGPGGQQTCRKCEPPSGCVQDWTSVAGSVLRAPCPVLRAPFPAG